MLYSTPAFRPVHNGTDGPRFIGNKYLDTTIAFGFWLAFSVFSFAPWFSTFGYPGSVFLSCVAWAFWFSVLRSGRVFSRLRHDSDGPRAHLGVPKDRGVVQGWLTGVCVCSRPSNPEATGSDRSGRKDGSTPPLGGATISHARELRVRHRSLRPGAPDAGALCRTREEACRMANCEPADRCPSWASWRCLITGKAACCPYRWTAVGQPSLFQFALQGLS